MTKQSNFKSRIILAILWMTSMAVPLPAAALNLGRAPKSNFEVEVTVTPSQYEGVCPGTIKFTAKIHSDSANGVKYTWLRSDGATSPIEGLGFTAAGDKYVSTTWTLGDSAALPQFEGWEQLRIISPTEMLSNQAKFTLKCTPGNNEKNVVDQSNTDAKRAEIAPDKKIVNQVGSGILKVLGNKPNTQQGPIPPDPPNCQQLPGGCPTGSPQSESARFRITVNGFRCEHRTNDKFLDEDGAKDEVFMRTDAALYDLSTYRNQLTHQSPVIGDSHTRPERLRGGRASSIGGGNGGFEEGDGFPSTTTPWIRTGAATDSAPPMLAWEGVLTRDSDALALMPSIWESDINIRIEGSTWVSSLAETWATIDSEMRAAIRSRGGIDPTDSLKNTVGRNFDSVRIPDGGNNDLDRPIGMQYRGGQYGFVPQILVLTYDAADRASRDNSAGLGEGIIPVRFKDSGDLVGNYTMFLQVERLGECAPDLSSTFNGPAEMRTTNGNARGPFPQDLHLGIQLTNCRSTVAITRFDPLTATFPTPVGDNTATLTLTGGGTGAFSRNGRIDIPIQLTLRNTNTFGGTSTIDLTLSTDTPGGSRTSSGHAVLSGSGVFRGGFLDGSTGSFLATGDFSPVP